MASKYIQLDLAWMAKADILANRLNCKPEKALYHLVRLWSNLLLEARPEEPPRTSIEGDQIDAAIEIATLAGWPKKKADEFLYALEGCGYVQFDGVAHYRIRGMSRYEKLFCKKSREANRMREWRKSLKHQEKTENVTRTKRERGRTDRDIDIDRDTYKELKDLCEAPKAEEAPLAKGPGEELTPSGDRATATPSRKRFVSDALVLEFEKLRKAKYKFSGAKDGKALDEMLKLDPEGQEILRRWRVGLQGEGWYRVDTIAQLGMKWNELASPPKAKTKSSIFLDEDYYSNIRPEDMTL